MIHINCLILCHWSLSIPPENIGTILDGERKQWHEMGQGNDFLGDHSFSKYAKFSEKLTFLTPDTHIYVCISGGKK